MRAGAPTTAPPFRRLELCALVAFLRAARRLRAFVVQKTQRESVFFALAMAAVTAPPLPGMPSASAAAPAVQSPILKVAKDVVAGTCGERGSRCCRGWWVL